MKSVFFGVLLMVAMGFAGMQPVLSGEPQGDWPSSWAKGVIGGEFAVLPAARVKAVQYMANCSVYNADCEEKFADLFSLNGVGKSDLASRALVNYDYYYGSSFAFSRAVQPGADVVFDGKVDYRKPVSMLDPLPTLVGDPGIFVPMLDRVGQIIEASYVQ